jgi:predicted DNA-binding protein with PD1-like motif
MGNSPGAGAPGIRAAERVPLPKISGGRFVAFRLEPGDDLIAGLHRVRVETGAKALAIVTCVGSLSRAVLRHAAKPEGTAYRGPYEIVSLVGTIDPHGEHIHITISDGEGRVFGGHLFPESEVRTTAEFVVLILDDVAFRRGLCAKSGYDELIVE